MRSREAAINSPSRVARRVVVKFTPQRVDDDVFCSSSRQDALVVETHENRVERSARKKKKSRRYGFNADGIRGLTGLLVRRECRARV